MAMGAWRLSQRLIAVMGLIVVSPLLAVLAVLIRTDSRGPALYRGARVGLGGHPIVIHKLRTMSTALGSAPGAGVTGHRDPRITRIGRLLRRTRIDELPQLWDVARGELALVGPRPEAPEFVDLDDPRWQEILSIRPGITGATQLRYLRESEMLTGDDPEAAYRERLLPAKIESDLEYLRNPSVRRDLAILAATIRGGIARG